MNHHRIRRPKFRSNGRGRRNGMNHHPRHGMSMRPLDAGQPRYNNFGGHQNAEKLIEKYNNLAKEALLSGDRILSENYFQHADHFSRIVANKNIDRAANQALNVPSVSDSNIEKNENVTEETSKELNKSTD